MSRCANGAYPITGETGGIAGPADYLAAEHRATLIAVADTVAR